MFTFRLSFDTSTQNVEGSIPGRPGRLIQNNFPKKKISLYYDDVLCFPVLFSCLSYFYFPVRFLISCPETTTIALPPRLNL